MDFLKVVKRRTVFSELTYIVLNLGLVIAILSVVIVTGSLIPGILLVLMSKWRILAVRPRYWIANITVNTVDIIVSVSYVVLLFAANGYILVQLFIAVLYTIWILILKPRSSRKYIILQALIALFLGITALSIISYNWPVFMVVIITWIIAYSSMKHMLDSYDETHAHFFSLLWALILAELSWLIYHWMIAYSIPGAGDIKLPQVSIIMLALFFVTERIYNSYSRHGSIRLGDIVLPIILSFSIILVLLLFFSEISINTL